MGKIIETTTKELRAGIAIDAKGTTVKWESTGHLSVQLLDASGTVPLTRHALTVDIPKEGSVSLETDDAGKLFHPDVPFIDYELDLGDCGKVVAPAVASRSEVHRCAVVKAPLRWVDLLLVDDDGLPISTGTVTVDGQTFNLETSEEPGRVRIRKPIATNSEKVQVTVDEDQSEVELPLLPVPTTVRVSRKS